MIGKGLIGMEEFIIPKTSLDLVNKIMKAYFITYSENGVKALEVSKKTGYSVAQIWKSNHFLINIGLLEKIDSKFILTSDGKQYASHLMNQNEEEAYVILKRLMLNYKPIEYIINFLKLEGTVSAEKLRKRIIDLAKLDLSIKDHKAGLKGLIEILLATKIIISDGNEKFFLGDI